jgi:hypothetical protein
VIHSRGWGWGLDRCKLRRKDYSLESIKKLSALLSLHDAAYAIV